MENSNGRETLGPSVGNLLRFAWLHDGSRWLADAVLTLDGNGVIETIGPATPAHDALPIRPGLALPGMSNLHSHAFQRALAGLAERRGPGSDSYWSWRDLMYRAASELRPEELGTIARHLYFECLEAGYTGIAEFHYLHRPGPAPDCLTPLESAGLLYGAATAAGLPMTLLPVLYQRADFDRSAPTPAQKRFVLDTDEWLMLREDLITAADETTRVGVAFHSLRAVSAKVLRRVVDVIPRGTPVHIHVAEQPAEVDACLRSVGRRPVAWLLDEFDVDGDWCLVHATHVGAAEVATLAGSGAVVGLCPITEANLGDGLFPLATFVDRGGRLGIGSDSHVAVDPVAELRCLEYGQRLATHARNVAASTSVPDTATNLWCRAAAGGAQALGRGSGRLEPGQSADLTVFEVPIAGDDPDAALGAILFGPASPRVLEVRVAGEQLVRDGRHHRRGDEAEQVAAIAGRLARA